jgi:hypothetical protein
MMHVWGVYPDGGQPTDAGCKYLVVEVLVELLESGICYVEWSVIYVLVSLCTCALLVWERGR